MDRDITLSCWHPGGTDDHGELYSGSAEGFVEWLWPVHAAMDQTKHTIQNILIELDGNDAYSESYYLVYLRLKDGNAMNDLVASGRYCDHFQRREGHWRIKHRQAVSDWIQFLPVAEQDTDGVSLIVPNNPENQTLIGSRDKKDFSYSFGKGVFC
jgi:hypothetical protein